MNSGIFSVHQVSEKLMSGTRLFVAGDEELLTKLPKGRWIGGTIPYFMSEDGGVVTSEKLFAIEVPDYISSEQIKFYDQESIQNIYTQGPKKGFSMIIMPASSEVHLKFAIEAPSHKYFAKCPLVGWVSGTNLNDIGRVKPKVINGETGEMSENKAIVMHIELKPNYMVDVGIINIFSQGSGDVIEFLEAGFTVEDAIVNGKRTNFAHYCRLKRIDVRLPLVANHAGATVNVSIQNIDLINKKVDFYAPVFPGIRYKQADPIQDYVKLFSSHMPKDSSNILFSCNCILNFLYSDLEGRKTGDTMGPITFGEVAYQLLNQTMIYLNIQKV